MHSGTFMKSNFKSQLIHFLPIGHAKCVYIQFRRPVEASVEPAPGFHVTSTSL